MMSGTFLNYNEASAYRMSIGDPVTRELTSLVLGVLDQEGLKGKRPEGAFDVLFFTKIVEQAMSSHREIASLLKGESLLWPCASPDNAKQPTTAIQAHDVAAKQ